MTNGVRGSALALFFVLGMAFMGAMFLYVRPDWGWHERARVIEEPAKTKFVSYPRQIETRNRFQNAEAPPKAVEAETEAETQSSPKIKLQSADSVEPEPVVEVKPTIPDTTFPYTESRRSYESRANLPLSYVNHESGKTLRGRAILNGVPPVVKSVQTDKICGEILGATVKSQSYVVGADGGLRDVVVVLWGSPFHRQWPVFTEPKIIESRGCLFVPYVAAMQIGQKLVLRNTDSFMHNFHIMGSEGPSLNRAVFASREEEVLLEFPAGLEFQSFITIKCDVHPWMYSYLTVVAHPFFAVTDSEGRFEIKGLPTGMHKVVAIHRRAGEIEEDVTVGEAGGSVEFQFPGPEITR